MNDLKMVQEEIEKIDKITEKNQDGFKYNDINLILNKNDKYTLNKIKGKCNKKEFNINELIKYKVIENLDDIKDIITKFNINYFQKAKIFSIKPNSNNEIEYTIDIEELIKLRKDNAFSIQFGTSKIKYNLQNLCKFLRDSFING
jgi:hypothetical protein